MKTHFLSPLLRTDDAYGLRIARSGTWLARSIEPAFTSSTRKKGLLGRTHLADDVAIVIAPSQGVHTFGMQFGIDLVGVARDGRVVKIRHHVPPRRLMFALTAFAIVELAGGACERCGLEVGDVLRVESAVSGDQSGRP